MKHLRIKTKLFQRAALTLLLAVAGITNASAELDWVGNSAINVNGTWYYCGKYFDWCSGGQFNDAKLGLITTNSILIGAQTQNHDNYNTNHDWNGGSATMYFRFDGMNWQSITLDYNSFGDNNNKFQSGGIEWTPQEISLSALSKGTHTIEVYFQCHDGTYNFDKYDNNYYDNVAHNYVATFTIGGPISVAAKQAPDNNYWTTFYCGNAKYAIDSNENACAYTATVSGSTITLHKLGKVIPEKTAVIIVGQDNSISMNTSNASVEYTVGNNLHGLDLAKPASTVITYYQGATTIYMLSDKNSNFGFHDLGTNTTVPSGKAFLALDDSDGAHSRGFTIEYEDDGTTGIKTIDNGLTDNGNWYSLDGRKLNSKPTTKGVYINNGKKIIIK